MATDYSDLLLSPQDRFLYQKFLRFSKPQPTGGSGGGSVVPQPQRPTEFDTSVLPTSPNYVNPRTGQRGQIADFTQPNVDAPSLKDYILGRPDDPDTVTRDEKVNPVFSYIGDRIGAKLGFSRADRNKAERERIARDYRDSDIAIQFLDENDKGVVNELVQLGRNKNLIPEAIRAVTDSSRPYRIIGLDGDLSGKQEYDNRAKRLIDNQDVTQTLRDYKDRQAGFTTLLTAGFQPGGPTASSDIALVFAFMKILDPDSVVRESEFELTEVKVDFLERFFKRPIRKIMNKDGEFLSDDIRANHINQALTTFYRQMDLAKDGLKNVERMALRDGIVPEDVMGSDISAKLQSTLIEDLKRTAKDGDYGGSDIARFVSTLDVVNPNISNQDFRDIIQATGLTVTEENSGGKYKSTQEYLDDLFPLDEEVEEQGNE